MTIEPGKVLEKKGNGPRGRISSNCGIHPYAVDGFKGTLAVRKTFLEISKKPENVLMRNGEFVYLTK